MAVEIVQLPPVVLVNKDFQIGIAMIETLVFSGDCPLPPVWI